jgi:hypothetical protein
VGHARPVAYESLITLHPSTTTVDHTPMGLRMPDIHAPTVSSRPTAQSSTNGTQQMSLQQLMGKKDNLEAELSALSSVLDSVGPLFASPLEIG